VAAGAGNGRAVATAGRVRRALADRGWSSRLEAFDDLAAVGRWAALCRPSFSHLIAVGGDATMSAAALAALRHDVPLLPVPTGFGNLFGRTFAHPRWAEAVVDLLDHGEVMRIDAGELDGEIFLAHESWGALEDVQMMVEEHGALPKWRLLRLAAYFKHATRVLPARTLPSIRVEVDGALLAADAALVTVANVRTYGPFLPLTPAASPIDGALDVFVVRRTTTRRFWTAILGRLFRLPGLGADVSLVQGRRVSVTVAGRQAERIRCLPAAVPLVVPGGCSERLTLDLGVSRPLLSRSEVA